MKALHVIASSLVLAAAAFLGCRGSVDRVYDEELPGPDASLGTSTSSSSGSTDASRDAPPGGPATIGGTVVGLLGSGLVLQNNDGDDITITAGGAFSFPTPIAGGQPYKVTVRSQPEGPTQTCTVTGGEGIANGVPVLGVTVTCSNNTYGIGGTVAGLTGTGLVLSNNGGNDLRITANGPFTFANKVQSGSPFNVVVKTAPTPPQNCVVSGGTGTVVTAGVDSIVVNCGANTFTVGGSVTGLAGTLVISNGGVNRTVSSNGAFAFPPVNNGTAYSVTLATQPAYPPAEQTCTITKGTGTVSGKNVTDIVIACQTKRYAVGGTISGVTGPVVLRNNGPPGGQGQPNVGDKKTVSSNGAFTFEQTVASGSPYDVTVFDEPPGLKCTVANQSGTVKTGPVTNVSVTCQ